MRYRTKQPCIAVLSVCIASEWTYDETMMEEAKRKLSTAVLFVLLALSAGFAHSVFASGVHGEAMEPAIDDGSSPPGTEPPEEPPCEECCDSNGGEGGGNPNRPQAESGSAGQPVNLFTGRETHKMTDMVLQGVYPIRVVRQYDSLSAYDSPLGYGWAFMHDKRLYTYPDNSVVIRYGCGQRKTFQPDGQGGYTTPPASIRGSLAQNGSDFEFTYLNGNRDAYDSQGRLARQVDVNGN